ncbi:Bacterial sugar transferase [hydrothermal vent metagenome]|uniref:Bacterial sugar transferase n=1 Tax=hydrothermal vent metagenome TaxID=652676 RepID=A0A1W1CFQ1_9ZZZZ
MIILGDRYTFSKIELERLKKRFSTINHISYTNMGIQKSIKSIKSELNRTKATLIILNTKSKLPHKFVSYLAKLEIKGVKYITLEHFLEKYLNKCYISHDSKSNSLLDEIHTYTPFQYCQKRVLDYIAVIALFPITLIAIFYTWTRIKQESPGPLFFEQKRVGLTEREFTCIKLRSMHIDAEADGAKFASKDDPRAYPWGKKIRDNKLDELIQLWNVFKGEMHFVGPRPERKIWTKEFEKDIPYYNKRHVVAPGITGLAQIKYQYGSGKLDAEQKLMYDLYYIKHWSIILEIKVIWKTALFVLTKKREDLSNF